MSCKDSREMWMKQKDEPIRVAQIMGKLWAGGVEMVVFNYYRAIDKSKIQFDFYYDADSTVEPPQDLIDMGARFYKIPPYQKLPQYIRELKKHLKENQYLIVHSHLNTLSVFPLFVAWMCRVPVRVAHNHSVPSGKELKRDALKYFLRIFGRVFPTDYFACSEKAGRWMFGNRNYDAGKVVVIKNATDFERFRADEETIEKLKKQLGLNDKFVIGHIGRFTFAKNHEFLLDVFKKISDIRNDAVLLLVGDGETVFPFLGIRLIAVTDNFDSTRKEDMESLALPIRNMVNAMYAKDISKKIWTSLQRKKEAGYAVGNDAPYGYIRNPMTKRNEIDPEAAFYVQLIFQWELMGVPIFEIARRMTLLQVPTPREWHRKMVEGKEVLTYKKWGVTTIRHILENQTYVGDTINNKSTQKLFAGQDRRDLPKEQWYVAKNTHPAIIARDDFEKVQKILNKNRVVFQTVRAKSEQIRAEYQNDLAGMVFCADCGRQMEFERLPHGAEESKKVCYYICKARQADDKCIGHQIPEKLLKALIMDQLHLFIVQLSDKRKVLEELQKIEDVQNPVYRAKGEIMSLTDKVSQMAKKREQLYADYVAGVVDSEDYQLIREDYSRQYDGLRAALQEAENKKTEVERQIEEYMNMTSHLEEHLDNFEFDIQLVKSLVQKIEVSADKRIRIVFGFQDVFTELGKESAET